VGVGRDWSWMVACLRSLKRRRTVGNVEREREIKVRGGGDCGGRWVGIRLY
jgi:hypothetical protein